MKCRTTRLRVLEAAVLALLPIACVRAGFESNKLARDLRPGDRGSMGEPGRTDLSGELLRSDRSGDRAGADLALPGSFGAPTLLAALSSPVADDDPSLTGDQLEVYFASYRSGGPAPEDIYRATRPSLGAPWSAPQPVAELNSASFDCTPRVSLDGLTLHFSSMRTGNFEVYVSTRSSRSAVWSAPAPVPALNSNADDYGGELSQSGLTLAIYSDRGGDLDLYLSKRASPTSPWGVPVDVTELETPYEEGAPMLDPTERVIFFFSDRPGGKGHRDLWMATRATPMAKFGPPAPIVELNTAEEESDLWISPDLRTIYFGSARAGNLDLYMATR